MVSLATNLTQFILPFVLAEKYNLGVCSHLEMCSWCTVSRLRGKLECSWPWPWKFPAGPLLGCCCCWKWRLADRPWGCYRNLWGTPERNHWKERPEHIQIPLCRGRKLQEAARKRSITRKQDCAEFYRDHMGVHLRSLKPRDPVLQSIAKTRTPIMPSPYYTASQKLQQSGRDITGITIFAVSSVMIESFPCDDETVVIGYQDCFGIPRMLKSLLQLQCTTLGRRLRW